MHFLHLGLLDEQLVDVVGHVEDLVFNDTCLFDDLDLVPVHVVVVFVFGFLELVQADLQTKVGLVDVLLLNLHHKSVRVVRGFGGDLGVRLADLLPSS